MKGRWKEIRLNGMGVAKESRVCLGSMEILERAIVVATMAGLMYPLLVAASSNAAASDLSKHFSPRSSTHGQTSEG